MPSCGLRWSSSQQHIHSVSAYLRAATVRGSLFPCRWAFLRHRTTQACRRQRTTHRCRRPHITLVCRLQRITVDCLSPRNTQVFLSVLSLPVCWLQRTSVDCLSQRNTQVPPPFLTECAGGRPQHITVDCLRPIDVFFFLQACGEVLVGNTGHFDNEIDLVGSEGVDGHLVLLKRWPARSSSTQWAPTA